MGLFETAKQTAGEGNGETAILIDRSGALRVVEASGWQPEALRLHYGAEIVYLIARSGGAVRLRGCSRGETCLLEWAPPALVPRPPAAPPPFFAPRLLPAALTLPA